MSASTLPPRPRLVLRVGFVGRRELSDEAGTWLRNELVDVMSTIGRRLAAIVPGVPVDAGNEPAVAAFYRPETNPLLRLVTGLCEGGDAIASVALEKVAVVGENGRQCLDKELAAVLPFDVQTYRQSRPVGFRATFDTLLSRCAWVMTLDGRYEKPNPDTNEAMSRRARAYRAQSAFVFRQSDILFAAADPDATGQAGGTMEAVSDALAFELPVVFFHTARKRVYLIEPDGDLHAELMTEERPDEERTKGIERWVNQLTADPDRGLGDGLSVDDEVRARGQALLTEFFEHGACPPLDEDGVRQPTHRERWWEQFKAEFEEDRAESKALKPRSSSYAVYALRASNLTRHYIGLYRGAFLLNYGLAIVAVLLAALSLTLLGTSGHTALGEAVSAALDKAGYVHPEDVVLAKLPTWLLQVLLALALGKVGILAFIAYNTHQANHERWNDRAVDYRYLAERLRALRYLPYAGSHQPPAAAPPQFASRALRQSTIDWLFDAIVRAISPADLDGAAPCVLPTHDGRGTLRVPSLITIDPPAVVTQLRDSWIEGQVDYHEGNAKTMHALHEWLETVSWGLGRAVVGIVWIDIVLVGAKYSGLLCEPLVPIAKIATPWLMFASAVLPAVVAAMGGVRFQSECQRLAERSAVMRVMLKGRDNQVAGRFELATRLAKRIHEAPDNPATNPGCWAYDALRLTELVATDFVQEVAEWSVLYAKEVSEPG